MDTLKVHTKCLPGVDHTVNSIYCKHPRDCEWPTWPDYINNYKIKRKDYMGINAMITYGKILWSLIKFSLLILKENLWRSVWRICLWILGLLSYYNSERFMVAGVQKKLHACNIHFWKHLLYEDKHVDGCKYFHLKHVCRFKTVVSWLFSKRIKMSIPRLTVD